MFALLNTKIREYLRATGIYEPTPVQEKAIPKILEGKNALIIAPTGLGKTESALLPVFHRFLEVKPEKGISTLYITPLRALNRDMLRRTIDMGKFLGIDISVRHGDTPQHERYRQSKKAPDMLITTPETFQILFTGKKLREALSNVRWVIIDEIHELADEERGAQLSVGLERLEEISKFGFQRIGLSATIGTPEEVARLLGGLENGNFREVEIIDVLLPNLEEELVCVNTVQKQTDAGEVSSLRVVVAVGDRNGHLGVAKGKGKTFRVAIRNAIKQAKLNIVKVARGCGSWQCGCGRDHSSYNEV